MAVKQNNLLAKKKIVLLQKSVNKVLKNIERDTDIDIDTERNNKNKIEI